MSSAHELRILMARLSDGDLEEAEFCRLCELLKADPIAQEEYLDHLLLDGLLEREFIGGHPSSTPGIEAVLSGRARQISNDGPRSQSRRRLSIVLAATVLFSMGWLFWNSRDVSPVVHPLTLANAGFENDLPVLPGKEAGPAWHGDEAHIVERFSGVTPLEGNRMLRFVKSTIEPEASCELYQVVALRDLPDFARARPLSVEASAFFNGIVEELEAEGFTFGVAVFAFADEPTASPDLLPMHWGHALTFSGSQEQADGDAASWQQITTRMPLPAETEYLLVKLAVNHSGTARELVEFPGHFADRVALSLVSLD